LNLDQKAEAVSLLPPNNGYPVLT